MINLGFCAPQTVVSYKLNSPQNLTPHQPEPSVAEPSNPGLSKAPPPSYQAASNFSSELPPPYPGGPGPTYPPSWTNPAYPPPSGLSEPVDSTPYTT